MYRSILWVEIDTLSRPSSEQLMECIEYTRESHVRLSFEKPWKASNLIFTSTRIHEERLVLLLCNGHLKTICTCETLLYIKMKYAKK